MPETWEKNDVLGQSSGHDVGVMVPPLVHGAQQFGPVVVHAPVIELVQLMQLAPNARVVKISPIKPTIIPAMPK